ncbi:hypothetical protein [Hymenobacter negativus]|uniref:Lipocalin-like domain-containing protein n=1 Tax=Hymenobacter negativus TaxID=2795026 RepID=A0ABS3QHM7_9BACT|nr:hypothetical protein [Hymenobacter negativus]MBO2010225.1 hypothetical protein [Hymenobacter negativus]
MRRIVTVAALTAVLGSFLSCASKTEQPLKAGKVPITGTWQLVSRTVIEKGDTVTTASSKDESFIKIINDSHFAFLQHDLKKGKDTAAVFVAGGGRYSLKDSLYSEHLEYCSARNWEDNDFAFTITLKNDTLTQSGVEKVESAGVNRINIERYVRVKP